LDLELYGELANILAACEGVKMQNALGSKVSGHLSVVAGVALPHLPNNHPTVKT
jgi:hypothetical protein